MKRCPRCHTTMISTRASVQEGSVRVWHCLGCGKEILADPLEQEQDDRIKAEVAAGTESWRGGVR